VSKNGGAWGELCELLVVFKSLLKPPFFANTLKFVVSNIAKYLHITEKNYENNYCSLFSDYIY